MGLGGSAPLSLDDPENWSTVETGYRAIMGFYPPNVMPEEIMSDGPERLRAVVVSNSNPLRSYADAKAFEKAFERLDLLVTSDIAMSETARLSDHVLPAKSAYEKWGGTFWGFKYPEYYFHLRRSVCEPVGEPKEDAEIWSDLADALGLIPEYPPALGEELFQKFKDTPGDILMAVQGVENYLTAAQNRDRLAGTPLHKSVPCRVSAL
jgi:anaerobic selenocysteine-containing dehydrogenase